MSREFGGAAEPQASGAPEKNRRFVLLDRDGTINEEIGYVLRPDELRLIPGALDALAELRGLGLGLVVVTNQSPVGRGMITAGDLNAIHERLRELLAEGDVTLDRIEVCPHRPDEGCACRKPGTLMVDRAAAALGFDPREGWIVGDHGGDMALGRAVGARTILLRTGHGEDELAKAGGDADVIVDDLAAAADLIRAEVLAAEVDA
ncbi:MAG TPA: HAD-IIIA family hydrolase [Actinomycetota bacterium]|nr:HAD-IIIA family hydrolase [Actinomycetota bacterium]